MARIGILALLIASLLGACSSPFAGATMSPSAGVIAPPSAIVSPLPSATTFPSEVAGAILAVLLSMRGVGLDGQREGDDVA